ncbi:hypothetical protein, partial [Pseudomonas reactans]|uniref:hypothetical protein n=1 Tax=Pseudomonas reactans TaxID=117680 RepID=UPI001C4CFF34
RERRELTVSRSPKEFIRDGRGNSRRVMRKKSTMGISPTMRPNPRSVKNQVSNLSIRSETRIMDVTDRQEFRKRARRVPVIEPSRSRASITYLGNYILPYLIPHIQDVTPGKSRTVFFGGIPKVTAT